MYDPVKTDNETLIEPDLTSPLTESDLSIAQSPNTTEEPPTKAFRPTLVELPTLAQPAIEPDSPE
jgi:hypothetical protein